MVSNDTSAAKAVVIAPAHRKKLTASALSEFHTRKKIKQTKTNKKQKKQNKNKTKTLSVSMAGTISDYLIPEDMPYHTREQAA